MSKKDLIAILALAAVFAVLGVVFVGTLFSTPHENYSETSVPEPIESGFDEEGVEYMQSEGLRDYTVVVDGVETPKNPTPFAPLDGAQN